MTSEFEALKTNEFLRRRKLRLQQVREQSKDIAKKVRQRAKVEKLRQVVDLDAKKHKEYFDCQDRLVKHLEVLYERGVRHVGASHQSASEITQQDEVAKTDLAKVRGKEATAALRRQKQEKLDQQRKVLERKLQAREVANEISRDKSSVIANKLLSKPSSTKISEETTQKPDSSTDLTNTNETKKDAMKVNCESEAVKTIDMATQWEMETVPNEWEPVVPALALPVDKDTPQESDINPGSKTDKNKRLDLFALSKEMPSSLRGKHSHETRERDTTRPSLTLVSEYLQNRKLRLREKDPVNTNKKPTDDMQSLKQTILHTRVSNAEGSPFNVCQVLDEQIVPVPSWRAERSCQSCSQSACFHTPVHSRQFKSVTNSQINQIFSSIRQARKSDLLPSPVLRGTSPFRRSKVCPKIFAGKSTTHNEKLKNVQENPLNRKPSVQMYNHSTRDTRELPCSDNRLVVRDLQSEEDAYSQAMKEVSSVSSKDIHQKKVQDMRNKVAMTKQNVEKEYKDTMNFLNSLPKDKCSNVMKNAYMDERRQQMQEESRQQKMQQEFKKIEKECRRRHCTNKRRSRPHSPKQDIDGDFDSRDFQYSWMPVPESDGNLAIHAIPNTVKHVKSGNNVKFSQVDSYHEYRSRHKHTPPTKDTGHEKQPSKKVVEALIIDNDTSEISDSSSMTSDTSSVENLRVETDIKSKTAKEINKNLSDAERIIIYKVLDSRTDKKSKKQAKLLNEIAKSLSCIGKGQKTVGDGDGEQVKKQQTKEVRSTSKNGISFEQLNEGVYKMNKVEEQGDNITSMYFTDHEKAADSKSDNVHTQREKSTILQWESGDCLQPAKTTHECQCSSASKEKTRQSHPSRPPTAAVPLSSSSTRTTNDTTSTAEGGYIKLVDEAGQEAGKFFIGASGLLNNKTYEVVIQLRKKDDAKEVKHSDDKNALSHNKEFDIEKSNKNVAKESSSTETEINNVLLSPDGDLREVLGYRSLTDDESKLIPPQKLTHDVTNIYAVSQDATTDKSPKDETKIDTESSSQKKDMCDKSVGVHTHSTCAPKLETLPRSATTTYTQTTLSSPIHRPVFFHMSSSTSTAYMSPPELILPKFLRPDYVMTEDEICNPVESIEMTEKEYCEEFAGCTCRKCMHAIHIKCKKSKSNSKKIKTPPNTARTPNQNRCEAYDHLHEREVDASPKNARPDKAKCKHHNCRKVHLDQKHCHRNKRPSVENIRSLRNINTQVMNVTSKNKYKPTKKLKSNLNPIIKDYVNKLLALNRQGLKAIEVADQECSSVGTPGSSIINVPNNVDERKPSIENTISLEQIKNTLKRQIIEEHLFNNCNNSNNSDAYTAISRNNLKYSSIRTSRRKPVHKIKSLNISKHLLKRNKSGEVKSNKPVSPSSTDDNIKSRANSVPTRQSRSKSSPTPRPPHTLSRFNDSDSTAKNSTATEKNDDYNNISLMTVRTKTVSPPMLNQPDYECSRPQFAQTRRTSAKSDSEFVGDLQRYKQKEDIAISMSTQTNQNIDTDTSFMKLAEDKLQNMEKIADLTEKCTKRLSNLAKVLEEVRKNKTMVYSQISSAESTDSQLEHKSDKINVSPVQTFDSNNIPQRLVTKSPDEADLNHKDIIEKDKAPLPQFTTILTDIPKPIFKVSEPSVSCPKSTDKLDSPLRLYANSAEFLVKSRPKPPPALSRLHFKHGQEHVIPHELSTVIEVDSPMSMKHKNQSTRNDAIEVFNNSNRSEKEPVEDNRKSEVIKDKEPSVNPDLLQSNANLTKKKKISSTESSDESKFQMIDLQQFNEIMLEPFISIQEYAKQYNMEPPDEGSHLEDIQRDDAMNDDMSSLHSDGSLPDVIAELLKRNIITEPFKFDTASNINSTTVSSESTLSMLALSKVRKGRKRASVVYHNKENIAETSDTLSISSNPDLENAFKKLGMGWASSTLKKTKERLALSSSSNTSSSSLTQFKMKSFNQDIPALVTDSVSSAVSLPKRGLPTKNSPDKSKNAEQQTTLSNSMTVKEFLRNELAKKITFNNKSNVNDTEEEFVSLFETKMPDEMKETSPTNHDERSIESAPSAANRARTSTPVQIFKSMTYHSSTSSNLSNGLFSNADDLSSVKMTSNSMKNHSTSDKDDLTIPNFSLRMKKGSDCSKSD